MVWIYEESAPTEYTHSIKLNKKKKHTLKQQNNTTAILSVLDN